VTLSSLTAFSRRHLLTGLASLTALLVLPRRAPAQQKAPKTMVQYQETPKNKQECDQCLQFVPPNDCKLVAPPINPKGWCSLFAAKPKK
jgi:hypothetical protein